MPKGLTSGTLSFFREVTKYFMDFLETDFHKHKLPKRVIRSKNSNNLLVGLNLKKYESFHSVIAKLIASNFAESSILHVRKGQHKTKLPKNVLDLIEMQIGKISQTDLNSLFSEITLRIQQEAILNAEDYDLAFNNVLDATGSTYYNLIVHPLIQKLEKPLANNELGDDSDIFMMEQELVETFVQNIGNQLSEFLKRLITKEVIKIERELGDSISLSEIRNNLLDHFSEMKIADLFDEIKDLENNKAILDKQDFYLYFGSVGFSGTKYPVFYIPINVNKDGDIYSLEFDSQVYVNKKALEYINQEFNKARDAHGTLKTISERIIYLSQHQNDLQEVLERILVEIQTFFELRGSVNFRDSEEMQARGAEVSLSNSLHFALFDKSDEALVNDYEEILTQLEMDGGELSEAFQQLLRDFLEKNPESINSQVESEWDETDTPDKLVAESPIPLNSEQLQILNAVKKPNCKYVIVEGPPGTGKSHTITAIIFDAILNSKSTLVLSDKKEALDVVEKNITEAMNTVRFDQNFQNPILRLGKTGNTYSQILTKSSITDIKNHYRSVKANLKDLDETITKSANTLKEDIQLERISYSDIEMSEISEFVELEQQFAKKNKFIFDLDEVLANEFGGYAIGNLKSQVQTLNEIRESRFASSLATLIGHNPEHFSEFLDLARILGRLGEGLNRLQGNYSFNASSIKLFSSISVNKLPALRSFIQEFKALRKPIVGYMFTKKKLGEVDSRFGIEFETTYLKPSDSLDEIEIAFTSFELMKSIGDSLNAEMGTKADFVSLLHLLFISDELKQWLLQIGEKAEELDEISNVATQLPKSFKKIQLDISKLETFSTNKLITTEDAILDPQIRYVQLKQKLEKEFESIPDTPYQPSKKAIEQLVITKVAHKLDGRVIDFYENNRNDAETLRTIIRGKQKFPRSQFEKLNNAFPCILAGIRDYAEYIPLNHKMFDLVIIDEASQVSLAQAFPALIRAEKVLILGDRKQFSNIKAAQARSDTNREYLHRLQDSFKKNVSMETEKLVRLNKFNIKTSVLDFFEYISNYSMQLTKHFRGYKEIISYSNKYFYRDSLQVMKIRAKSIDDVIKFTKVKAVKKDEVLSNSNLAEVEFIKSELLRLKDEKSSQSVGIITPHTNQQKLLVEQISRMSEYDYFVENFKLKIMTFDTCQGEERDIIYYSMVATEESDKLWGVFIKDLANVDVEEDGQIKAQRLNVGFSRGKETIHFVISKDLDKFSGSIGEALRHYQYTLEEGRREREVAETDANSPMESEVLHWFYQTDFWKTNKKDITFIPQFEIGKYLKQLDLSYTHPMYKVDFLVAHRSKDGKERKIIIEYDGFEEHFTNRDLVNEFNYEEYLSDSDLYRQKVLESYGYRFIRLNRFNIGENPVSKLNARLLEAVKPESRDNPLISKIYTTIEDIENGDLKECPKCKELKELSQFKDSSLARGIGRICIACKTYGSSSIRRGTSNATSSGKACPKCGSRMVRRNSRYGSFYGCSRYPYCKGTKK